MQKKAEVISISSAAAQPDQQKPWYILLGQAFAEAGEEVPPAILNELYAHVAREFSE